MDEEKKNIILAALKRAIDTHPQAWRDYRILGSVVLDCTEFVSERSAALKLSKGFTPSCREIEDVLRKEKHPDLLKDFHLMTDILDDIRELYIAAPNQIRDVILITSEFLLAIEEIEESTE
jgi:hypothetical protein